MSNVILIVDDNHLIRESLAGAFAEAGYEVLQASNGAEALQVACLHVPSIVLTDIEMPIMDGRCSTRAMRTNPLLERVPVVALTGMPSSISADEKLFELVLIKPMIPREVVAQIARMASPKFSDDPMPSTEEAR